MIDNSDSGDWARFLELNTIPHSDHQTSAEPCTADQEARAPAGHARPASDLTPGFPSSGPGDPGAVTSNGGRVFLGEA